MWKLYSIGILLISGTLPVLSGNAQDIAPTGNLSRLLHNYRSAPSDTARINGLLQLSNWYLLRAGDDRNNLDSSTLLANQAAGLSDKARYPNGHEEARFLLAKTAFKEKDWSGLRRLADACSDSTRVRLALTVINTHHTLKDVAPHDDDSARDFFRHVLATPTGARSHLNQTRLLLRLAISDNSRSDSIAGNAPPLNVLDFARKTGLAAAPVTSAATPTPDRTAGRALTTLQREAAFATAYEAGIHWFDDKLVLAEKGYLAAIDIDRQCPTVEAWPYFSIIQFYLSNGNASKALFYGLEAIRRLQATGNPGLEYEPYWCLGQVNDQLGKSDVARSYYDSVLAIMSRRHLNPDAWLFSSVTQSYLRDKDPVGALAWLHNHVIRGDMGEPAYRQLVNQCFGDCYVALGDFTRAEPFYIDCYTVASHINRYNLSLAAFPLGQLYIRTRQYDKARTYLQPLLQPADYYIVPLYIQRDVHLLLYVADSARGDYLSAMKHLRTQEALNDSLFNIARNGQIQELTFRFETERKDRDLRLQQEHIQNLQSQAKLQRASLAQAQTFRNTLIWGTLMLLAIIGILYSRYRTKQRSNRLLKRQQMAINQSNQELQRLNGRQKKLLAEKEWLMNEVHHRVKTNLQIVTSLLNMQVGYLNDEFTLHAFGEIGSRIRTLSLIHQRLYREDGDPTLINMRDYIHELSVYLIDHYDRPDVRIARHIGPIELNIGQCVPVGLILNEAITNALLFAFPPAETDPSASGPMSSGLTASRPWVHAGLSPESIIEISMHQDSDGRITLTISDNGVGLPPDFNPDTDAAMGLQLIKTLGMQLDGQTQIENRQLPTSAEGWLAGDYHGLRITVMFQREGSDLAEL